MVKGERDFGGAASPLSTANAGGDLLISQSCAAHIQRDEMRKQSGEAVWRDYLRIVSRKSGALSGCVVTTGFGITSRSPTREIRND